MQVHSVWEHLLEVTDFDRHVRREFLAVDFKSGGVDIVEGPHPELFHKVLEVTSGLEMDRFVFLDGHYWDAK